MSRYHEDDELVELVAEALYERAMIERRTFADSPTGFTRQWRDEPYVPMVQEGKSRPVNWRDGWRMEAVTALGGES